jgi:hypothetical protein
MAGVFTFISITLWFCFLFIKIFESKAQKEEIRTEGVIINYDSTRKNKNRGGTVYRKTIIRHKKQVFTESKSTP